jgi:hypothetical protein
MTKEEVLKVLEDAPVKFRIDFPPYWDWYEQSCVPMMHKLRKEIEDGKQASIQDEQREHSGGNDGRVVDGDHIVNPGATPGQSDQSVGSGKRERNIDSTSGLERI